MQCDLSADRVINQGDDIAGIVYAVGINVTEFRRGDRVAALHEMTAPGGSYAEYAVSWEHCTFHIPEKTTFEGWYTKCSRARRINVLIDGLLSHRSSNYSSSRHNIRCGSLSTPGPSSSMAPCNQTYSTCHLRRGFSSRLLCHSACPTFQHTSPYLRRRTWYQAC